MKASFVMDYPLQPAVLNAGPTFPRAGTAGVNDSVRDTIGVNGAPPEMATPTKGAPPTDGSKPALDQVATWERMIYQIGLTPRFNFDALVRAKGLPIYDEMLNDEQVKAATRFKRDAIMGRGWTFKYDDKVDLPPEEKAKRIAVCSQLLEQIDGSFSDTLNAIATGVTHGFSLIEKVFSQRKVMGQTYYGYSMFLPRPQATFWFYTDEHGMLDRCVQWVNGSRQMVDLNKFIYYVHQPEYDRYFGRSELREAYKPWYIKTRFVDFWAVYMERFAGGFMIFSQDQTSTLVPGSDTEKSLQEVLQNLHGASGILLPKGIMAKLEFPQAQGTEGYANAIEVQDLAIAKSQLVPNLLGLSHTGKTGAYAQSQTQLEAFLWTVLSDSKRYETCVQRDVIQDIGRLNWGDDKYPQFRFKSASLEWLKWVVVTWAQMTAAGNVLTTKQDEDRIRELMDMPPREDDELPLVNPVEQANQQATQQNNLDVAQVKAQGPKVPTVKLPPGEATTSPGTAKYSSDSSARIEFRLEALTTLVESMLGRRPADEAPGSPPGKPKDGRSAVVPHGHLTVPLTRFTAAAQRVHFSVIEHKQTTAEQNLTGALSGQTAKITKRLMGTNEHLATLLSDNVEGSQNLEASSSEKSRLNSTCTRALRESWNLGQTMARAEVDQARGSRRSTFADLRDTAAAYFDNRAFRMAGDLSDKVRNTIQQELATSIKYGRSPDQTREAIWDRLASTGVTTRAAVRDTEDDEGALKALNDLWVDTEDQAAAYLNTVARTGIYEAMNEARFAEFTDPALNGFVEALEYSAILDDRTTEICQDLDTDTWAADSPLWDTYRPPNHFNCRSVLIPVTQADGWDGEEDPEPDIEPQVGFGPGGK